MYTVMYTFTNMYLAEKNRDSKIADIVADLDQVLLFVDMSSLIHTFTRQASYNSNIYQPTWQ